MNTSARGGRGPPEGAGVVAPSSLAAVAAAILVSVVVWRVARRQRDPGRRDRPRVGAMPGQP